MLEKNGYPTLDQIKEVFPKPELLMKPKAVLECYQEIPCNPCATSCPFKAITIGEDINKTPKIDYSLCTGCGMCVYSCPGLAIMVVSLKEDEACFKVPYELLPLPNKGDVWHAVDRSGEIIGKARIENVMRNKNTDHTAVITACVPNNLLYEFVTVRCPE